MTKPARVPTKASEDSEGRFLALARSGKLGAVAKPAIRRQQRAGLPMTFKKGNQVIKRHADGREEVLDTLPVCKKFKFPSGVAVIR